MRLAALLSTSWQTDYLRAQGAHMYAMNKQQSTSGGRIWVFFALSFHFCLPLSCSFHLPPFRTFPVDCTGADDCDCSRRGLAHGWRSKLKAQATEVSLSFFVYLFDLHLCYLIHLIGLFMVSTLGVEGESSLLYLSVFTYSTTILFVLSSSFLYSSSWLFGCERPDGRVNGVQDVRRRRSQQEQKANLCFLYNFTFLVFAYRSLLCTLFMLIFFFL